ncbi:MAG TPA: hypothetical protein VKO38_05135 [Wenzhouxiangella sp.]|nr:hypothetical protein [Wenzhouxiangella sp.]
MARRKRPRAERLDMGSIGYQRYRLEQTLLYRMVGRQGRRSRQARFSD